VGYARDEYYQKSLEITSHGSHPMTLTLGPLGQISRSVQDISQSEAWYKTVLGLPHLFTFGKLAFFDCGRVRLFLSQEDTPHVESILYLKVTDIQKAAAELKSRGVEFVDQPHMIHRHADGTEEWMTFFKDPEGRLLALMSQTMPTA
jgi:catechol 2,3-dioxygenase-like lactoylglutathione lyase family enzyme